MVYPQPFKIAEIKQETMTLAALNAAADLRKVWTLWALGQMC